MIGLHDIQSKRMMQIVKVLFVAAAFSHVGKLDSAHVSGGASTPPLMILDELDSGVGARLGKSVGRILRRMAAAQFEAQQPGTRHVSLQSELSKQHQLGAQQQPLVQPELSPQPERSSQGPHGTISQILCVSHLPQVGIL